MQLGTRSVLYGAHCLFIHPWFVAAAWFRLFGFRQVPDPYLGSVSLWNPLLWLAFFVHDIGYVGKPNMDGPEGELHPAIGADILGRIAGINWWSFVFYHSRFLAKGDGAPYSMLCVADKLAVAMEPWWLYLPRVRASGEVIEYMHLAGAINEQSKYHGEPHAGVVTGTTDRDWFEAMTTYMRKWVAEHRDGRQDLWTPGRRQAADASGTYQ
jgi:hypothetical protein